MSDELVTLPADSSVVEPVRNTDGGISLGQALSEEAEETGRTPRKVKTSLSEEEAKFLELPRCLAKFCETEFQYDMLNGLRKSYLLRHHTDEIREKYQVKYPPHIYMKNFVMNTFDKGRKGFKWSKWASRRCKAFLEHDFQTWMGAGSSGKSTEGGLYAYVFCCAFPGETTINLYSTTKSKLRLRIWKDIVRFQEIFPFVYEHRSGNDLKIVCGYNNKGHRISTDNIHGIFAQAILQGASNVVIADLAGMHNRHNFTIVDEMQGIPESVMSGLANQMTSGESVRFLGMGNPMTREDVLGSHSVPWDGWDSVNEDTLDWVTRVGEKDKGHCLHFNAYDSPGIEDPETFGRFFTTLEHIKKLENRFGRNSGEFYTQIIGFPRAQGNHDGFLDYATVDKYDMTGRATFFSNYDLLCGFDPAFSTGGDRAFLSFALVGIATNNWWTIDFLKEEGEVHIPIEPGEGEDKTSFLVRRVSEEIRRMEEKYGRAIKNRHFAMDTTGQDTLADILGRSLNCMILPVSFNKRASSLPVSKIDPKKLGYHEFKNKVSEMWHNFTLYSKAGQIRGLSDGAITEFTSRRSLMHLQSGKRIAESKLEVKQRLGYSTDNGDSKVLILEVVKSVLGVLPFGYDRQFGKKTVADQFFDMLGSTPVTPAPSSFNTGGGYTGGSSRNYIAHLRTERPR